MLSRRPAHPTRPVAEGLARLGAALEELRKIQFGVYYGVFLSEFADALGRVGRAEEGLRAIDEALARAERNEERWYQPELLRIKGEIVLRQGLPNAPEEAERYFVELLDWSRRQETIAWQLRAATSLARLYRRENRTGEARNILAPVYAQLQRRPGHGGSEGSEGVARPARRRALRRQDLSKEMP